MSAADFARLSALAACWGLAFVFTRAAVPDLGPFALVWIRALLAALLLYALLRRQGIALRPALRWKIFAGSGALGSAVPFVLIALAQTRLSASYTVILVSIAPLFSGLVAAVWIGEPFTARKAGGLVLGIGGVALLTGWNPMNAAVPPLWTVALTLTAALMYGIAGVYTKRYTADIPPLAAATGNQIASVVMLLPFALAMPPATVPGPLAWANVIMLAVFSSALAFLLYFRLIADIGPVKTLAVNYITPLFGVGGGVLFLGEQLTPNVLAGAALIVAALALVLGEAARRRA